MLIPHDVLRRIASGEVTLAFRRWRRPTVKVGTKMRTAVGVIEILSVDEVNAPSTEDARAAGFGTAADVLAATSGREGSLYRIGVRFAGPDPRLALRQSPVDDAAYEQVMERLDRFDATSGHGAWTRGTLFLIAARPGVRAVELAADLGREKKPFKIDVRKLKELGLTESLQQGYRLSPRGLSLIARWTR
ncbi:MAG: hypothetical protein EHM57_07590 [Actinobacteria bacterium]|nr:MAG: hypothetical protein EHM57_07590 [Actinomycetota bacterium]